MTTNLVLGSQLGDEGKGKARRCPLPRNGILCSLSGMEQRWSHRLNGGIEHDLHTLPSGLITQNALKILALQRADTFETIKVATGDEIDSRSLESFPASLEQLSDVTVKYETLPGWWKSIKGIKSYHELPLECRNYVEIIESAVGVKIVWIGTGPDREDMIAR